ncbi:sulfurtransferase [Nocardioides sp. GXZ039]|uniref:sulfurtransferase n=1 Tax=Nocardioides sp. GXZ039 TaxID=3136018 RepID=UPI0030F48B36
MSDVLIDADGLAGLLESGGDVVVLDVRWKLGGPPGHGEYLAGHVPGAVFVDLETELAAHGAPTDGRHPLPEVADLESAARRWGIGPGSSVVVYDGEGNLAAARAWWLLRWAGLPDVRILDGALPAWIAAGHPVAEDDVVPEPGDVVLAAGALPVLDVDDVEGFARTGTLLDARAGERYRGETEPIDPVAGHVPGAVSAPTGENLAPDGTFLPAAQLRERFASIGVSADRPVAAYCGSGVTAAHEIAALSIAGYDAALYPGSWSQWSNLGRRVATGPS